MTTEPPSFAGSLVGRGPNGVVVILRVFRIDGDERNARQILAVRHPRFGKLVQLCQTILAEAVSQAVVVDGDEAYGLFSFRMADALRDARGRPVRTQSRAISKRTSSPSSAPSMSPSKRATP